MTMEEKYLIVSLVSDQTLPNVQLIKEYYSKTSDYLFITTKSMVDKGVLGWIERGANISSSHSIIVEEYSVVDIKSRLRGVNYSGYDRIIVNITGGTKVMTLAVYDFFKGIGAEIYYLTGKENKYLKISPIDKNDEVIDFRSEITLLDYLYSYGFEVKKSLPSGVSFEQTSVLFNHYCKGTFDNHDGALAFLRSRRDKTIGTDDYHKVESLINDIEYKPFTNQQLSKLEVKYLSGEWFEEYIGELIKRELCLVKVNIPNAQARAEIMQYSNIFRVIRVQMMQSV